jgi:hypothetical protein
MIFLWFLQVRQDFRFESVFHILGINIEKFALPGLQHNPVHAWPQAKRASDFNRFIQIVFRQELLQGGKQLVDAILVAR